MYPKKLLKPNHLFVKPLNFTIMPIIKDPVHNPHRNGQFGVAWFEPDEKNPDGYLAVYDKKEFPQMMRLTSGWYFEAKSKVASRKYNWCGVTITNEIIHPVNTHPSGQSGIPAQGLIAPQTLNWIGGTNYSNPQNGSNASWFTPGNLTPPDGDIIYPLP
jgi:hypothetical protein